ncbi:MAG TPA: hypothetical protein PKA37_00185 [Planctomycetota bacterium]|jgi:Flp pilus assembly protein TadD|nr:hypothetical protein [Planctomycetota bacterium]
MRTDLLVLIGLFVFGLGFIGLATMLGKEKRARYRLEDPAPESAAEALAREWLSTLRVRSRALVRWIDQAGGKIPTVRPTDVQSPIEAIYAAILFGDHGEAVRLIESDQAADSHRGELRFLLGMALEETQLTKALSAYAEAQDLLPTDPDPSYRRALLHFRGGEHTQALSWVRRAVAIESNHADLQLLLGKTLAAMGDVGLSKRAFYNVLDLRPGDAYATKEIKRLDGTR